VTSANQLAAGRDVYMIAAPAATRSAHQQRPEPFPRLYGNDPWDATVMSSFIATMHNTRPSCRRFRATMPSGALVAYLKDLQQKPRYLPGAQAVGFAQKASVTTAPAGQ